MIISPFSPSVMAAIAQHPEVKRQVRLVANTVARFARQKAPAETGNLRKNIAVEQVRNPRTGAVEYHVGWKRRGWYGSMVELGTEAERARPHLRPAADQVSRS